MKWSKLKQRVEESFAPSVRGRVRLYSTRYQCSCGRGWITVDGQEIADLSTRASALKYGAYYHENTSTPCKRHPAVLDNQRTPGTLVEKGEFSRFDLHRACWELVHNNVRDSLKSKNPLIVAMAILHEKVGKQTLQRMSQKQLHPLSRALLEFRMQAEGMPIE